MTSLDKNFRLARSVRPARYTFTVRPDVAASRFEGRGAIELSCDEAIAAIVLHGAHVTVSAARVDGRAIRVTPHEESQTLTFTPEDGAPIAAGVHRLEVEWSGIFHKD